MSAPTGLPELLAGTVASLRAGSVPDESLATVKRALGIPGLTGASRMVPSGRAWRLGVLLLDSAAHLYATGDVTRAIEPLRAVTNRSAQAEARREDRRAAARGRFPEGEVVNFGYRPLSLDEDDLRDESGVIFLREAVVMVRWSAGDPVRGIRPLADYLADRVGLLIDGA